MRVLAIIPARGGSKGIPGKNIKVLGNKPLIAYTIEAAQQATGLSRVILSSDDEAIISLSKSLGLEVPFVRPAALATDEVGSLEVVQHALRFFIENNEFFDAVCLLQPTTPFRTKDEIDRAIETFCNGQYDALVSVRKVPKTFNPHWVFEADNAGLLHIATGEKEIIKRRQDLPQAYYRDGSIYITKSEVILQQNSLYGNRLGYIVSDNQTYVNLDTMDDWEQAEKLLKQQNVND